MDLANISTMSRATLENLWQKHLPKVPMPNLNLRTLRSALAYELQIKEEGGISKRSAQILRGYLPKPAAQQRQPGAKDADKILKTNLAAASSLTPGTVLVREWNGRRYQVNVLAEGFEMDGRSYASLSQIAKTITGTAWSGPRFFGLVRAKESKKPAKSKVQGYKSVPGPVSSVVGADASQNRQLQAI